MNANENDQLLITVRAGRPLRLSFYNLDFNDDRLRNSFPVRVFCVLDLDFYTLRFFHQAFIFCLVLSTVSIVNAVTNATSAVGRLWFGKCVFSETVDNN